MTARSVGPTPTLCSPIATALTRFLEGKRTVGYRYRDEARALGALDRFLVPVLAPGDPVLTLDIARAFVAKRGVESETTRTHRLTLVREVCRFLALEEPRTAMVPPRWLGIHRRPFVPRVLTHEEGRRFLQACGSLRTRTGSPIRDTVLGTALVLLYLTGLRAGEALRLTAADVDFGDAVVRVRDTKFGKSRLVPIAADVTSRLRQCQRVVARHFRSRAPDAPFFPAPSGHAYSITALRAAFHQVLAGAEIPRRRAGRALRLHDLRHSFAVLRLLLWYRQQADLGVTLPALATYLGHVGIASSQRYLQLTEDLVPPRRRRTCSMARRLPNFIAASSVSAQAALDSTDCRPRRSLEDTARVGPMARSRTLEYDCVVVGGGLLGLVTAELAAARGHRVVLFRAPTSSGMPDADSQRNHAWLHSGLLYSDQPDAARLMPTWGRNLLHRYGVTVQQRRGVFQFDAEADAERFEQHARRLKLTSEIRRIQNDARLRHALGPFFRVTKIYYEVPDSTFDEAGLMEAARQRGRERGVTFRQATVRLRRVGERQVVLDAGAGTIDETIEANNTALCAGAANPSLLGSVGLEVPLGIFRSPLLRINTDQLMSAPLFVDRASGLTVTRHDRALTPPTGATIVGDRCRTRLHSPSAEQRVVPRKDAARLRQALPPVPPGASLRFTAGFKIEFMNQQGQSSVLPWVQQIGDLPGLYAGVPGKATLALYTGRKLVAQFRDPTANATSPSGLDWLDPIRLHHEHYFADLDEVAD